MISYQRSKSLTKQSPNVLIGENTIMTFGKYRGLTVKEIIAKDESYIKWLLLNDASHMYGKGLIRMYFDEDMQPLAKKQHLH